MLFIDNNYRVNYRNNFTIDVKNQFSKCWERNIVYEKILIL